MKIGILTFWWSEDNYGQILQSYALQQYLKKLGHDPFLIRYDIRKDFNKALLLYIKVDEFFRKLCSKNKDKKTTDSSNRRFKEFQASHISMTPQIYNSYEDLCRTLPDADIYIVGSDQVWNYSYYPKKVMNAYFLDFNIPSHARFSFAASWGKESIDDKHAHYIAPMLSRFHYVGVREESGIEICRKCKYPAAEWVPDPTMLLTAGEYRKLYKSYNIPTNPNKYLLLYILINKTDFDIEEVYGFAASKGLEVILITGNNFQSEHEPKDATIPEWISLIDNAEYVITNSFHCGIFCTIFNKQYGIIPLAGNNSKMNTRMNSLFSRYHIESRYIRNHDFSILDRKYEKAGIQEPIGFIQELKNVTELIARKA